MSTVIETARNVTPPPAENPWYYGWRDVHITLPDGTTKHQKIPLTLEDALHPQEGDYIVESNLHDLLTSYLASVCRFQIANDPHALVLSNTGVYWDHPDLDHHAPDVCVIFGIKRPKLFWPSFFVRDEGVSPRVIIELVSPNTRKNDVVTKLVEYHMAEVPFYYLFDKKQEQDPWTLRGYQWAPIGYLPLVADPQGRMWLESLNIWLVAEGQNIACYDGKTNQRIGDYVENLQRLNVVEADLYVARDRERAEQQRAEAEKQRAETEKQRAEAEKQRAETEKQRAETEKQRAEAAEAKASALEAEIARLRIKP